MSEWGGIGGESALDEESLCVNQYKIYIQNPIYKNTMHLKKMKQNEKKNRKKGEWEYVST